MTKAASKTEKAPMFNILDEAMEEKPVGLQLIVLAPSGTGKSHLAGTYPGKVLLICGDSEQHGIKSARKEGDKNIIPVCWGRHKDGRSRGADAGYRVIKQLLDADALKAAGIDFIALDSLTDLMKTISETQEFERRCMTKNGGHDKWQEPDAYISMIDPLLSQLRYLQEYHGIDFMVTCDLEIKQQAENGLIVESKPRLPSFSVAERAVQQFQDILMMSRVTNDKGENKPVIQMGASAKRVSKDANTNQVTKTIDFNPRLADVTEAPKYIKADLKEVLKLKGK